MNLGRFPIALVATSMFHLSLCCLSSFSFGLSARSGDDPVLARQLFYNNSSFDVISDENAIASDKIALREDQLASLVNYSSYLAGINGIFIDVNGLTNNVTLADFEFRIGNDDSPDQWPLAPNPSLQIAAGAGINGSFRIKLIWPDGSIVKKWLQVRLRANSNTRLPQDDIFYFGNAPGETGNSPDNAIVNVADVTNTRNNQTGFSSANITNRFDYNRDGFVRLDDISIARENQSGFTPLKLVKPLTQKALSAGLGRGVNFGNMLEAPNEGDWGLFVQEIFFDKVVAAGMNHIRLPVSWTNHAGLTAPYTINESFFQRVDWCVAQARLRGLKIIINVHHYDELNNNPAAEWNRALAIWGQIANRYRNEPNTVFFEILNEPHGAFNANPAQWNLFMADALTVIRATNPSRKVLVGPTFWNSIGSLGTFFPPNDPNLIVSVHYYDPFAFTHQGATWVNPTPPVGTPWIGTRIGFSDKWQSWSWNTTTTAADDGLRVTYTAGWAGLRFHATSTVSGSDKLVFTTTGAANLRIWLINSNGTDSTAVVRQTGPGTNTYTINLSEFGNVPVIQDVVFQNSSPNPLPLFTLNDLRLCGINANFKLIDTAAESLKNSFRIAAKFSLDNGLPLHVGEFGSYGLADLPSRVRWTSTVRGVCEQLNVNWAYWELAAGFGFYDPATNTFRTELLQALNPNFVN